jgi:hypothetical protein
VPVSVIVLIRVSTVEEMMRSSTQRVMLPVAEPLPRISNQIELMQLSESSPQRARLCT